VESAATSAYFLRGRSRRCSGRTYPGSGHRGCEALPRTQTDRLMMGDPVDPAGKKPRGHASLKNARGPN